MRRIIAFAIIRLVTLREVLPTKHFNFNYALPEVYTQVEMHFDLVAATIPCLRMFLRGCTTGWLGEQLHDQADTAMATKSAKTYSGFSPFTTGRSRQQERASQPVELEQWQHKQATATISQGNFLGDDTASDSSGRRIMVSSTIEVRYDDR